MKIDSTVTEKRQVLYVFYKITHLHEKFGIITTFLMIDLKNVLVCEMVI